MEASQFLSSLLAIVLIDIVLAGDNAIVIALAARQLPAHLQQQCERRVRAALEHFTDEELIYRPEVLFCVGT